MMLQQKQKSTKEIEDDLPFQSFQTNYCINCFPESYSIVFYITFLNVLPYSMCFLDVKNPIPGPGMGS